MEGIDGALEAGSWMVPVYAKDWHREGTDAIVEGTDAIVQYRDYMGRKSVAPQAAQVLNLHDPDRRRNDGEESA